MDNIKLSEEQFINMQESFMAFNRVFGIFFGVKKNKLNLIATILLILFVTLLQIVFVFPLAILKGYIILNTICIVYGFTPITFLILTAITEPGVILKKQINDNYRLINQFYYKSLKVDQQKVVTKQFQLKI